MSPATARMIQMPMTTRIAVALFLIGSAHLQLAGHVAERLHGSAVAVERPCRAGDEALPAEEARLVRHDEVELR